MCDDGKEGANEGQQKLTRRASDKPHPFERNKGFRTCRACGLPEKHEIHKVKHPSKDTVNVEPQQQSIEQLREQLRDNRPPPKPRFALSHIVLISGGLIVVVIGLMFLALFLVNNTVDKPLQQILEAPSNQVVRASSHFDGLKFNTLVFDLTETSGGASGLDVFRLFCQYAEAMKERHFTKVTLASRGVKKFTLEGSYFQQLGQEYKRENPVYTIRTFPPHLTALDGTKPFAEYTGELLDVVTKEVEQFTEFSDQWYARDTAVFARSEVNSSTVAAAEPSTPAISSASNDNWLVLDSQNQMDNTTDVSLYNGGTHGAVLTIRCANRETEAYIDTDTVLENGGVRVRFDNSAVIRQSWDRSASDKALFAPDAVAFARRLANTHILRFEFTPFEEPGRTVVFDVSGLDTKMQRVSDTCSWASIGQNHARAKAAPATPK